MVHGRGDKTQVPGVRNEAGDVAAGECTGHRLVASGADFIDSLRPPVLDVGNTLLREYSIRRKS